RMHCWASNKVPGQLTPGTFAFQIRPLSFPKPATSPQNRPAPGGVKERIGILEQSPNPAQRHKLLKPIVRFGSNTSFRGRAGHFRRSLEIPPAAKENLYGSSRTFVG